MQQEERLWNKIRGNFVFQGVLFVVLSFIEYLVIEAFLDGDIVEIGLEYGMKNLAILMGINLILVSLFQRITPAFFISETIILVLGIANYFVDAFRGYGIVYMDLFAVKTAATVAGDYSYQLSSNFAIGCALAVLCFCLCLLGTKPKGSYKDKVRVLKSVAGIVISIMFFLWLGFGEFFWENVSGLTWDHNIGMGKYGYVLYVTANAGTARVEKPKGYSAKKADEILDRYQKEDSEGKENTDSGQKQSPNIIMIMNEAFSDLSVLGKVAVTEEYLKFYHSLEENTIKGYAQSSVYGGYTANSEFEFLTGCTKAYIPGNPYLQYMDDYLPSVISNIKAQEGYETAIAMHPYYPSGYNRNRVYPLLEFDTFLSLEDFQSPWMVREYVSDISNYEKIKELYENKEEGTSLCVFDVTMQNHSSYDNYNYEFEEPVEITNYGLQFEINQYLSLIKMSDDALKDLVEYFERQKEPTIIVLFGDHQPHLPDLFYHKIMGKLPDDMNQEETMQKYLVPFMIWANYDIEEAEIERTSLNYLSTMLMETAGLELTDYQRFLQDLYQHVPSISANGYYDASGNLYELKEDSEVSQWLEEYEIVQYNYLFDKKNHLREHYQLESK